MLIEISPPVPGVTASQLIPADVPARPRADAVLDDRLTGRIWVDDPGAPRAVLVIETGDGTVYGGGRLSANDIRSALTGVGTASGDLIFGFAGLDDPTRGLVPGDPYLAGEAIDFLRRRAPDDEAAEVTRAPVDGGRVVRIDASLLPQTTWYADTLHAFGGVDRWEAFGVGYGVMIGDELVAEAMAGPRNRGQAEIGVVTRKAHRGRGHGTLVSRLVARACEAQGDTVWWNANAENAPSIAIARRLGFQEERRYDLVACRAPLTPVTVDGDGT